MENQTMGNIVDIEHCRIDENLMKDALRFNVPSEKAEYPLDNSEQPNEQNEICENETTDENYDRTLYCITHEDIERRFQNSRCRFKCKAITLRKKYNYEWLIATYKGVIMEGWKFKKCGTVEMIRALSSLLEYYSFEEICLLEWYQGSGYFEEKYNKMLAESPELCYLTLQEIEMYEHDDIMHPRKNPIQYINVPHSEFTSNLRETEWESNVIFFEPDGNKNVRILKRENDYSGTMVRDYYLKKTLRIINSMVKNTGYATNPWNVYLADANLIKFGKSGYRDCSLQIELWNELFYENLRE